MKKTTHQADAIAGGAVQGHHWHAGTFLRARRRGFAGEAIFQVAQQEHRIAVVQPMGCGVAVDMQPAPALYDQVETRARQAMGARMPIAAVATHMEQAGVEFKAV